MKSAMRNLGHLIRGGIVASGSYYHERFRFILAFNAVLIGMASLVLWMASDASKGILPLTIIVGSLLFFFALSLLRDTEARNWGWNAAMCLQATGFALLVAIEVSDISINMQEIYLVHLVYGVFLLFFIQCSTSPLISNLTWILSLFFSELAITGANVERSEALFLYYYYALGPYASLVCIGTLCNRRRQAALADKLHAVRSICQTIAHEMRTPILGITSRASAMDRLLPELTSVFRNSDQAQQPISDRNLALIESSFFDIEKETRHAMTNIDIILMNSAENPLLGQKYDRTTASELVEATLTDFPFRSPAEASLVTEVVSRDFEIIGPELPLKHVFFNLLQNSIEAIQAASRGSIRIVVGDDENADHTIVFEDSGPGIGPTHRARVFDQFYRAGSHSNGIGNGLYFCRSVLSEMGGSIELDSQTDGVTRFIITFAPEVPGAILLN